MVALFDGLSISPSVVYVEIGVRHLHGCNDHRPVFCSETILKTGFACYANERIVLMQIIHYQTTVVRQLCIYD